ncbi:MAG TPA: GEVED domain-containing protein, partial [Chitinophagales bacterium]|nr:GEVED domain-containing protein [Chitinophagales bacterium]
MFKIQLPKAITTLFTTAIACLSISYASAQDTILEQSFDFPALFPPFNWTNTKVAGTGAPGNWARVTTGGSPIQEPHSDPAEAKFNSFYYPAGTACDLSSEVVDLSVSGTYTVNFWMYRDAGNGNDKLEVYVNTTQQSAGGTLIGTIFRKKTISPVAATEGWYNYSFTIPASYNTTANYITFKAISDYGFNIYLDDIAIVKNVISIPSCATGNSPVDGAIGVCSNATISWDIVPYATGYKLTMGNNAPNYNNVASNLDLGNVQSFSALLNNSTVYKWRVRPYNENGNAVGCVQNTFTTASDVCYCLPEFIEPNCVSLDFIDDVYTTGALGNISNMNTGCAGDDNNYTYYSALTIVAVKGGTFTLNMQSGIDYAQGYGVWADWNKDGDFDDAGEFVYQSTTPTTALVSAAITVPETATLGVTRFRIRAFFNEAPLATQSCAVWNEGESEDYNIEVQECTVTDYYFDGDGDGYGNPFAVFTTCVPPVGYVINNTDCDDANSSVNPGAPEVCNGFDDNCNVTIDEGAVTATVTPAGATTVCKGAPLLLNANTGVGYTYQWTRNGANLAGATASSYNVTKSGNYAVKVTAPGGCIATSASVGCTVTSNPNANISTPEGTDLCGISDLDLVANGGVGDNFIWDKNGVGIGGAPT